MLRFLLSFVTYSIKTSILNIPQNIMLDHNTDDIILFGLSEQYMARILGGLAGYMHVKE